MEKKPKSISPSTSVSVPQHELRNIFALKDHPDQKHFFPPENGADLEKLCDQILANGLTEVVEITSDGTVISGHRRLSALRRLVIDRNLPQWETIEVKVRYDLDSQGDAAIKVRLIEANLNRRHLPPLEELGLTIEAQRGRGEEVEKDKLLKEVGERRNVKRVTMERYWDLMALPLELRRLVDRKKLSQQVGQAILDHATEAETEELRQLAISGGNVKKRARELLEARLPEKQRQPPTPEEALDRFLVASLDVAVYFKPIKRFIEENIGDRLKVFTWFRRSKDAELVVPLLMSLISRSPRLDAEDREYRPTLGKQSLTDVIAKVAAAHKAARNAEIEEPASLRPAKKLPPLILPKNPAA
ncbi:ParB/RepB/Spo0J family partition protein [Anatilimnocola aggregata]|uniref:ParB/RepB/Spo0J family partition protein n=1 Tax=Anatilimnocola aggregata TaxID=2528021 RepID=UPI00119F08D8|nr:hypothetical protein [Anatilimnocola aggregata]